MLLSFRKGVVDGVRMSFRGNKSYSAHGFRVFLLNVVKSRALSTTFCYFHEMLSKIMCIVRFYDIFMKCGQKSYLE